MTETLTRIAAATDTAMADAIDTLSTLALARRHLPNLAAFALSFNTYTDAWELRAQVEHRGTEADAIDAVRTWADALTGGQTHLGPLHTTDNYRFRNLSANGTLTGSTPVEVWTHIDTDTGTDQS